MTIYNRDRDWDRGGIDDDDDDSGGAVQHACGGDIGKAGTLFRGSRAHSAAQRSLFQCVLSVSRHCLPACLDFREVP